MHVQAPTLTTRSSHRAPLIVGIAGLASAAAVAGVIALAGGGEDATQPAARPAVAPASATRVLDGSPILRGTESGRVLDGSAILRGTETPVVRVVTPRFSPLGSSPRVWDGASALRGPAATVRHSGTPAIARFQQRPPEGFRSKP